MGVELYDFGVDHFTIHNTRSRHEDTDYISASVAVAGRPTRSATQKLGDLNNGTFGTDMHFAGVPVGDNETAVFTYAIANSGHADPGAAEKALQSTMTSLAEKGATIAAGAAGTAIGAALGASIGTAVIPVLGTALGALAGWVVSSAGSLLFADCDGPVAAAVHTYSGSQLRAGTSQALKLGNSDHHPGTDSAAGCGSNSDYDVAWTIALRPFVITGAILAKWNSLGGGHGFLGAPQTSDTVCPDGAGHFVAFDGGSIYWSPHTNAFEVHGNIRDKWGSLGWEKGRLGYPVSDEGDLAGGGRVSSFEHGKIAWTAAKGAWVE